jgi:hypothetical protein
MSLRKWQEVQKMSWDGSAQGEFAGERKDYSFQLQAFRAARDFTLGRTSDEESFQPVG